MQTIIDSIKAKQAEQQLLLNTLAMWDELKAQGIDSEDVARFGWNPEFATTAEKRMAANWKATTNEHGQRTIYPHVFNFVRLKTGDVMQLTTNIKAPEFR